MSVYFVTKTDARQAEAKRREEIENPKEQSEIQKIPTGMAFLDLVNRRLDYLKAYNSERHYTDNVYCARRWIEEWNFGIFGHCSILACSPKEAGYRRIRLKASSFFRWKRRSSMFHQKKMS